MIDPEELEQLKRNKARLEEKLAGFQEGTTDYTRTHALLEGVKEELADAEPAKSIDTPPPAPSDVHRK